MKKRYISEAVGVPENIIESAIKLYEHFYAYVSSLRDINSQDKYKTQFMGDFRISDMKLSKINFNIEFIRRRDVEFMILGMGQASERFINSIFQVEAIIKDDEINLSIDLATPESFKTEELTKFLKENESVLIPIMAHELKHGYDLFKNNVNNLYSSVEYHVFSNNRFGGITPLSDFLFDSYYIHNIENLVRPTELAAHIHLKKIRPQDFYNFFVGNDIFKKLNKIKNSSYEKLRDNLKNYESQIDSLFDYFGENYKTIDEKVDRVLELFYINITNWKNDRILKLIYPYGVNDPLFAFMQTPEKNNYLDEFFKKSGKYDDDYKSFYINEEKYQIRTATNMIKKLGRLYELTYKNITEPMKPKPILPENKSIWNWDLYHEIKGTNNEITNRLKTKKEMLVENNLKSLIRQLINKKSPK